MAIETYDGIVAVITGGASGIGRATAIELARRGARVVVADLDGDGARAVAAEITAAGGTAVAVSADVAEKGTLERLRDRAVSEFGRADLVMNNVGVLTRGLPEHVPIEEWRRIIDVNLLSVVNGMLAFVPHFIEQGSGHIVNTASFAGLFTYSFDRLPYAATKAAIVQISEGLRLYLEPKGIGVTLLCPGPTRTNISAGVRSFGPPTITRGPGKRFGYVEPEDLAVKLADAVLDNRFLVVSDEQVHALLVERATDWDAFMRKQVESLIRET